MHIEFEEGRFPSPVLLRGTKLASGAAFRMMVIAVEETALLAQHKVKSLETVRHSAIETWIDKTTSSFKLVAIVCISIMVVLHGIGMVFKARGIPSEHLPDLIVMMLQSGMTLVAFSLLLDCGLLTNILRGEYLKAKGLFGAEVELERLLSVEQLLLSEENICKYDKIRVEKVLLSEVEDPIELSLLPALEPSSNYAMVEEVLGGVGL